MKKSSETTSAVRTGNRFKLYLGVIVVLNIVYVSLMLYAWKFSQSLGELTTLSKAEIVRLDSLASYTFLIEMILIAVIGLNSILKIKRTSELPFFVSKNFLYLLSMFLLGCVVAWIMNVPVRMLTQQLIGPFFIVLAVYMYSLAFRLSKQLFVKKSQ